MAFCLMTEKTMILFVMTEKSDAFYINQKIDNTKSDGKIVLRYEVHMV